MINWLKSFFGGAPTPAPAPLPPVYATEREALQAEFNVLTNDLEAMKARRRALAARLEELNRSE